MEFLGLEAISTFSLSHLIYVGIALVLTLILNLSLIKAGKKARSIVIFVFSLLGFLALAGTTVYNYLTIQNFDILGNLPLSLCGVTLLFGTLFSLTKVCSMKSFVGYAGIFAGLYGLLALPFGMIGREAFGLQSILYFAPYVLLFVVAVSMFTLKVGRPTFKNMGKSIITLVLVACFMHALNSIFFIYGVSLSANYWMTLLPARDEIAVLIFTYIPASFVYLLPYLLAFVILSSIISIFSLFGKKEKVKTYVIDEDAIVATKQPKEDKVQKEVEKKKEEVEEVSTEVHIGLPMGDAEGNEEKTEEHMGLPMEENEVQETTEHIDLPQEEDKWEDVIPESILEEQKKKEEAIEDIIIKDEEVEVEQKSSKEKQVVQAKPSVLFETKDNIQEQLEDLVDKTKKVEAKQEKKAGDKPVKVSNRSVEKTYKTYEVKEKPTQVQRKYSFAEADRKRKNDPTLGVPTTTKRNMSQNAELLKDLRTRINKLGK